MKLQAKSISKEHENTIPLINVVFLMLIFFLIAGTIAPSSDFEVSPVISSIESQVQPEEAISIRKDGTLFYRGKTFDYTDTLPTNLVNLDRLVVYPDRETPASLFIEITAKLQSATKKPIDVLIERRSK